MYFLFILWAAAVVVPDPKKKSNIISFSAVLISIICLIKDSGFLPLSNFTEPSFVTFIQLKPSQKVPIFSFFKILLLDPLSAVLLIQIINTFCFPVNKSFVSLPLFLPDFGIYFAEYILFSLSVASQTLVLIDVCAFVVVIMFSKYFSYTSLILMFSSF